MTEFQRTILIILGTYIVGFTIGYIVGFVRGRNSEMDETLKSDMERILNEEYWVGMEIMFVPPHVQRKHGGDIAKMAQDPDTKFGFISSWNDEFVYCRFWNKYPHYSLRTTSTSERCSRKNVYPYTQRPIDTMNTLNKMRANPEEYGWREQGDVDL